MIGYRPALIMYDIQADGWRRMEGDIMTYPRVTVLLIFLMFIAPARAQADPSRPQHGISWNYTLLAFNGQNARSYPQSSRLPPRVNPGAKAFVPHRNLPPGHNRGFGYGFERRHAQPGSIPAPRRPF